MKKSCGHQYNKEELYERQQRFINENSFVVGPIIIAENIHTPENVAAIIRVADSAGSDKVYFINSNIEAVSKKMSRIARNTDNQVQVEFISSSQLFELKESLPPIVAIEITSASTNVFEIKMPLNCCLLIGSERHGISNDLLEICDFAIHIPMYGQNGSMNVAQALSVVLFEWRRQQNYS